MNNYYGLIALAIYIACLIIYIRYDAKHSDDEIESNDNKPIRNSASPLDVNDEDATVASLIAAIECRNEYKKNVQIVSIRKVN